eukprot:3064820-Pyramimonas_sp.AAC.1
MHPPRTRRHGTSRDNFRNNFRLPVPPKLKRNRFVNQGQHPSSDLRDHEGPSEAPGIEFSVRPSSQHFRGSPGHDHVMPAK